MNAPVIIGRHCGDLGFGLQINWKLQRKSAGSYSILVSMSFEPFFWDTFCSLWPTGRSWILPPPWYSFFRRWMLMNFWQLILWNCQKIIHINLEFRDSQTKRCPSFWQVEKEQNWQPHCGPPKYSCNNRIMSDTGQRAACVWSCDLGPEGRDGWDCELQVRDPGGRCVLGCVPIVVAFTALSGGPWSRSDQYEDETHCEEQNSWWGKKRDWWVRRMEKRNIVPLVRALRHVNNITQYLRECQESKEWAVRDIVGILDIRWR